MRQDVEYLHMCFPQMRALEKEISEERAKVEHERDANLAFRRLFFQEKEEVASLHTQARQLQRVLDEERAAHAAHKEILDSQISLLRFDSFRPLFSLSDFDNERSCFSPIHFYQEISGG